jgi:hypothetical protein
MKTAHARALSRPAGALLAAIMLAAAGCSAGGGSTPAGPPGAAHDAAAVSSSGPAVAGRATGPISGRRGSGSRMAWAPSLPRCPHAGGTPAPGRTAGSSGRQARISRSRAAGPGGQAGTVSPAPASCLPPAPVPAKCPRNPRLQLPCREA